MKYHISKHGDVVECHAPPGECPKENFDSVEEGYEALAKQQGIVLAPIKKAKKVDVKNKNTPLINQYAEYAHDFTIELPEALESVLDNLEKVGTPLLVGGSIRDAIVGKENKDYDIEVQGTDIDTLITQLRKSGYKVDEVGKKFGVLKVSGKGVSEVDVSVPRTENKVGAGHRNFEVYMDENMTLEDAVARRDFTFNALMYDHKHKKMLDLVGGRKDLENKVLRHVSEKFAEDPLRVLRGAQFASRFGLEYAPETAQLAKKLRGEYESLSVERVREEWGKFFTKGSDLDAGLKALQDSGWDDLTPGMNIAVARLREGGKLNDLHTVDKDKRTVIGSAIMMSEFGYGASREFANSSNVNKKDAARAHFLATSIDQIKRLQTSEDRKHYAKNNNGIFNFSDAENFARVSRNEAMLEVTRAAISDGLEYGAEKDFIYGQDLIALGTKPGPSMKVILDSFRAEQYKGLYKDRDAALAELHRRSNN